MATTGSTSSAVDSAGNLQDGSSRLDSPGGRNIKSAHYVATFFHAKWFERMWVSIEYAFCRQACVYTADDVIIWHPQRENFFDSFTWLFENFQRKLAECVEELGLAEFSHILLGQSCLGFLQISVAYLRAHPRQVRVHLRRVPIHLGALQIAAALNQILGFWAFVAMQFESCSLLVPDSRYGPPGMLGNAHRVTPTISQAADSQSFQMSPRRFHGTVISAA
ncbi:hypothetical protein K469DRAFT_769806 [Zopfia rhizophila CBS 207.26]|uniref:Uncharacterized protein n=1 Tax=Zopfia rhizophila CBS 207.26 TaxID=1314779 RepID=A0A6A6ECR6_9PEZI|nr:hypothetical protein K469DRAFT_769806 [Zopfia rhizophila CBS 207.26]